MAPKSKKTIKTRQAILELLKRNGPLAAQDMAARLGLTPMAVRQHLYDLADQKLVSRVATAGPHAGADAAANGEAAGAAVGRPVRAWELTAAAQTFFPDGHAELAVELITSIRQTFGEAGLQRFVEQRSQDQIEAYRTALSSAAGLKEKLTALAEARTKEGYMAEVLPDEDGGYLFVENHCPICAAATACTGICSAELQVFQAALGTEVTVERREHLLTGARRCAYAVASRRST